MLKIDRYQIFAELERSQAISIYKALDTKTKRVVLIKRLHSEADILASARTQFLQEKEISKRFAHPNLRQIFDFGVDDDGPYLVLEYVEGPTLDELIKKHKKLPIDLCVFIANELAKAILSVHHNNVLHLDIKPQNIFISYAGEVKLGDLGLAQERHDETSWTSGTPAYMSPEQVLGQEVTEASDLFSFSGVLYEMLTGVVGFASSSLSATLLYVANWEPASISKLRPEIPSELVSLCQKLFVKNPEERLRTAQDVIDLLNQIEQTYNWQTTHEDLASFIESPETYRNRDWQPIELAGPDIEEKPVQRMNRHHWGITAVVSAFMFLIGVLFIKGMKERADEKINTGNQQGVYASTISEKTITNGFLYIQALPGTVIYIDGDSIATTPLPGSLELPPGQYDIGLRYAHMPEKKMTAQIKSGDTLWQRVEFNVDTMQ